MYRVSSIERTCSGCPTTWEGYTDKEESVYARYRWGYLRVEIGSEVIFGKQLEVDTEEDDEQSLLIWADNPEMQAKMRESAKQMRELCASVGQQHSYSGVLSYGELIEATKGVLEWPNTDFDPDGMLDR